MLDTYIALGDSMSTDNFPAQDAAEKDLFCRDDIGAASLLYSNESALYPEFANRDLRSKYSRIEYVNLATASGDVNALASLVNSPKLDEYKEKNVLLTLTLGRNDILQSYRAGGDRAGTFRQIKLLVQRYKEAVQSLVSIFPDATIVLSNVCDSTDGTGVMPVSTGYRKLPVEYLNQFNENVQSAADSTGCYYADLYSHFRGHGAECGSSEDFWYFAANPLELNHRGANEIRRVWLRSLENTPIFV